MICFQISIFEPLETTRLIVVNELVLLWFAFKLVSLNHWKQHKKPVTEMSNVVICFQISIFEPLETTTSVKVITLSLLWFAFKLVSLNHWKQHARSILYQVYRLWFAFKLVSLNHWKQPCIPGRLTAWVVICFQISIFEPLETTYEMITRRMSVLWFAFKLVSLNHWKQR